MAKKMLIAYKDTKMQAWTAPLMIDGSTEEALADFKESIERACRASKIPEERVGNEVYLIGYFNDTTGKIEVLEEKNYLLTLENLNG